MDVRNLLQLMNNGSVGETAYNLNIKHPQNGFYDTPAFKRIRSKEIASTRRIRINSGANKTKEASQRNLKAEKNRGAQNSMGGQQCGRKGKGEAPRHGHKEKKGKAKPFAATPMP